MPVPIKKIVFKTLKISAIAFVSVILLMFLLPYLFPQTVTEKIKQWAAGSINGKLNFTSTRLSFFKRFPSLTLTLNDFELDGSVPFQKDTLVAAKEVSLAIDLSSVFKSKIKINKIYLSQATINIQVDSSGKANYNVYKSSASQPAVADTSSASLGIEQILVENSRLVYNDRSMPMLINARDFNYKGSGDLSKDIFDLYSHVASSSADFYYGNKAYVLHKKINADLVTSINTKSLAFAFQKNDLLINQLPVKFKGRFEFLKDGYDMDFRITSDQNDLSDIFTALPAEYAKYVDDTEINGNGNIQVALTGKYIAAKNIMPDLNFSMKVRDGFVANKNTPAPVKNLYINMDAHLPGLNPDSLKLNIDSIYFNIGKDYFGSVIKVKGLKEPDIFAKINTEINLDQWNRAFGVKAVDLKGRYSLHMQAEGRYAKGIKRTGGLRPKTETVITSIPKFTLHSTFRDGYFKYATLPEAIKNISFDMNASCPDHDIAHATMQVNNLNMVALNNYLKGYFKLSNTAGALIDAGIKAKFHMADLKQFLPADSIDIRGDLTADVQTKGRYIPARRVFPVTNAQLELKNGYIQTKYYPHPMQDIQVSADIRNNTGTLKGLKVNIKPVSFKFEGQPFLLKADLRNFDDLDYRIASRGRLDIGKIYKVFALQGYDVKGVISTNFSLKGKQSDATAGRYNQLANSGTMKVKDIALRSELFPKPFLIKTGVFSFNQDKMKFDQFTAHYGKSVIVLNGALSNVIDYAVKPNSPLKGDFNLSSGLIIADDFMAFAGTPPAAKPTKSTGVILVPSNLDLNFTADVKKVKYMGLDISDAKGQMTINNGQILLKQTGFTLIGAPVVMDATYGSTTPQKAYFDYHINAKEFDIQRAYKEVKMFHDMASSAAHVQGVVSLDYKLNGKLNGDMKPIYPSIKGGGVLSVKKVKLYGFKLFTAVGKQTGHDSLAKGDVTKVDIKSSIANNIMTIERTKMRMAGFRPRFEGQVSLDGKLNLQFRLGLPPFGIFGIPMTITGTQENPKIKLGKVKKEDELKETADDEQ